MEFCVHGDILAHINKSLAEVSSTKRQQWVLQVCNLTHTLTIHAIPHSQLIFSLHMLLALYAYIPILT